MRTRHDRFSKEWLQELLVDFGEVETEREVSGEVRSIDLVFYPDPHCLDDLRPCSIEFFRNAVPASEIVNCRDKGKDLRSEIQRLAAQRDEKLRVAELPMVSLEKFFFLPCDRVFDCCTVINLCQSTENADSLCGTVRFSGLYREAIFEKCQVFF